VVRRYASVFGMDITDGAWIVLATFTFVVIFAILGVYSRSGSGINHRPRNGELLGQEHHRDGIATFNRRGTR
jgi:hypothetical protein